MKITLIKHPDDEQWMAVKNMALVTLGKKGVTAPDLWWKHKMLVCRHSPIRELTITFLIEDIPYWLSTEFSRHVHTEKFIRSQRNDRQTMYDRNAARQDAPVSMYWVFNGESIMEIANKRLCRLATPEAQNVVGEMCRLLEEACPEFKGALVPNCMYHGGVCHEFGGCGMCPYDGMEGEKND